MTQMVQIPTCARVMIATVVTIARNSAIATATIGTERMAGRNPLSDQESAREH